MVEQLRPQQGFQAADSGASAEARDGVNERDGDDFVLFGVECGCEGGGKRLRRRRAKKSAPFLLAAITIEKP